MKKAVALVSRSSFEQFLYSFVGYNSNSGDNEIDKGNLRSLGYDIGSKLGQKYVDLANQEVLSTETFKMRFICKDIWSDVFCKIIDTLQTDNQGIYILHDNDFQWFQTISSSTDTKEKRYLSLCLSYLEGLVHGIIECFISSINLRCEVKEFDPTLTIKTPSQKHSARIRRILFHVKVNKVSGT